MVGVVDGVVGTSDSDLLEAASAEAVSRVGSAVLSVDVNGWVSMNNTVVHSMAFCVDNNSENLTRGSYS